MVLNCGLALLMKAVVVRDVSHQRKSGKAKGQITNTEKAEINSQSFLAKPAMQG